MENNTKLVFKVIVSEWTNLVIYLLFFVPILFYMYPLQNRLKHYR